MTRYDTYAVRPLTGYTDRLAKARAPLLDVKYHTGWKQISANEFLGFSWRIFRAVLQGVSHTARLYVLQSLDIELKVR